MHAVEAGLAFGACRMDAHAVQAKVSRGQKLGFVTTVEAVLAEPLCQALT